MRLFPAVFLLIPLAAGAQICIPAVRMAPVGIASGNIDPDGCRLSNGSPYTEYSLVLPARGQFLLAPEPDGLPVRLVLRNGTGHQVASGESISVSAEAGAYTVAAIPLDREQSGSFKLRSDFVPEPNTMCRFSAPAGLNETLDGRLGSGSCRMPGGSPYDAYIVTALGPGSLEIKIETGEFTPYLILRGEDGRVLAASGDGSLQQQIEGDRRYTVVASAASQGGAGAYRLSLAFQPMEDAACRPVKTFTESGEDSGRITDSGCGIADPVDGERVLFNQYELKLAEQGLAELRMSGAGFNPILYLLDGSGNVVAQDMWTAGPGQAAIRMHLRPGSYTVLAFSSVPFAVDYTLAYTLRAGPPEVAPTLKLESEVAVMGTLSAGSSGRAREGIADVYEIAMPSAGLLEVAMASPEFTPVLAIRDADGSRIVADTSGAGQLAADLPAGTYTIVASTADGAGAYAVAYRFTARELPACGSATPLEAGNIGQLTDQSCRGANGQPVDYYEFTTPADGTTALTMSSPYVDSVLSIEDTDGNVVRRDDNSLGEGDALLVQFLPGKTYRVAARGADSTPAGPYEIRRYFAEGDRPAGCNPLRTVSPGDSVDARLDFTACQFPDDTFADVYQLDLAETSRIQVALDSDELDAYLLVLDAKGNIVAEDDDSGAATNALLTATLEAGSYFVVAKPLQYHVVGTYRLSLTTPAP